MAAAAAASSYPPWVILEDHCTLEVEGSSIADTNTLASCRTTSGHPISVALCLAAAPEGSRVCVRLPTGVAAAYAVVVAAHGDSVVIQVADIKNRGGFLGLGNSKSTDHFVYSAGDAAADPPLPPSASNHAYVVHTWTLRMDGGGGMTTWTMDGSLDATQLQLWALDGYSKAGLPRVALDNPVVSIDEPHAGCFVVCEKKGDDTAWRRIMVDMKSKTLLRSVFRCPKEEGWRRCGA